MIILILMMIWDDNFYFSTLTVANRERVLNFDLSYSIKYPSL